MMLLCGVDNLLTSSCVQQTYRTTITDVSEDLRHIHDLHTSPRIILTPTYTKQKRPSVCMLTFLKCIKKIDVVSESHHH
jgi:hypothetical protein